MSLGSRLPRAVQCHSKQEQEQEMEGSVCSRFSIPSPHPLGPLSADPLINLALPKESGYSLGFAALDTHMSPIGARFIGRGRYCHPRFPCQAMGRTFDWTRAENNKEPAQLQQNVYR